MISELNLDIRYRTGRKNSNADALSCSPVETGADNSELLQVAADRSSVLTVPRETDEIS